MKLVQACLLSQAAALATGCFEPSGAELDLLARRPDDAGAGVHVDLVQRILRLDPGAVVRYRIEPRAPGDVRLAARAQGSGTLEAAWYTLDRATGKEQPEEQWRAEFDGPDEVENALPVPATEKLLELRLAWHAEPGQAGLALQQLRLRESLPVERPSILLIVIDTLSARHLSAYGYPLETDPELVRLASESFLFERCYANASWTVPSFMALMTGLYSRAHEIVQTGPNIWQMWYLAENRWTLAESLRAAGYRTAGYVDNDFLSGKLGFAQGFDVYDESAANDNAVLHSNPDGGIRLTAASARSFLEKLEEDAPFFLFVHAFDVHQPYTEKAPPEERARGVEPYDLGHVAPVGGSNWAYGIVPTLVARVAVPDGELPSSMQTAPIVRAYDEGIRFLDAELGKFLAALREMGVLERSWLVFTADHGETMDDTVHYFGHGILDNDVLHVPLLIRPPGGYAGGKRIAQTVQLADLYTTLLELSGGATHGIPSHGRSLAPLLRGEEQASDFVLAETGITTQAALVSDGWKLVELEPTVESPHEAQISHPRLAPLLALGEQGLREKMAALELRAEGAGTPKGLLAWLDDDELRSDVFESMPRSGLTEDLLARMKTQSGYPSLMRFVRRALAGPFYELYDLVADPQGRRDVAAQHPEKVAELKQRLDQEQKRRAKAWRLAEPPAKPVELPPEDIRALEALGYGGGGDEDD